MSDPTVDDPMSHRTVIAVTVRTVAFLGFLMLAACGPQVVSSTKGEGRFTVVSLNPPKHYRAVLRSDDGWQGSASISKHCNTWRNNRHLIGTTVTLRYELVVYEDGGTHYRFDRAQMRATFCR